MAITIEKGKFPSLPEPDPKGVHEVNANLSLQHEEVKAIMTLQKGKKVDKKVEMLVKKTTQVALLHSENSSLNEKKERSPQEYISKALFPRG